MYSVQLYPIKSTRWWYTPKQKIQANYSHILLLSIFLHYHILFTWLTNGLPTTPIAWVNNCLGWTLVLVHFLAPLHKTIATKWHNKGNRRCPSSVSQHRSWVWVLVVREHIWCGQCGQATSGRREDTGIAATSPTWLKNSRLFWNSMITYCSLVIVTNAGNVCIDPLFPFYLDLLLHVGIQSSRSPLFQGSKLRQPGRFFLCSSVLLLKSNSPLPKQLHSGCSL